jgi:hypothetical protein
VERVREELARRGYLLGESDLANAGAPAAERVFENI